MTKLEIDRFYEDNLSEEKLLEYKNTQIKRHNIKSSVKRDFIKYKQVFDNSLPHFNKDMKEGICLGTRNEHEKNCFQNIEKIQNKHGIQIVVVIFGPIFEFLF